MAVAVKNTPDVASPSLLDRMAAVSLVGTAYVLGTLALVFYLLPILWTPLGGDGTLSTTVRDLVQLILLGTLVLLGVRWLRARAMPGVRAGIFVGLLGLFLLLQVTRWVGSWIESWSYDRGMFSAATGATIAGVVGLALLLLGIRFFLRPGMERFLVRLEEQGWFHARAYKALQGVRVRRGTIFGILVLTGAGIWTLLSHNTLAKGSPDWQLSIPFTGRVAVENVGDAEKAIQERFPDWKPNPDQPLVVDRYVLKEINRNIDPQTHVKILVTGASDFKANQIVSKAAFDEATSKLSSNDKKSIKTTLPRPASGPTTFDSLTLLPAVQFTVPLLLLALSLWLAWRMVNLPAFADFLIATEAEMNKVSWTTQKRLIQDTIVVLVTVVLMAFYLFAADQSWRALLSWPRIGVLYMPPDDQNEQTTTPENRPW